jgi:hypothetical protein
MSSSNSSEMVVFLIVMNKVMSILEADALLKCHSLLMVMSTTWDTISPMVTGVYKMCSFFLTREVSIFLNEAIISEEQCGMCFRPTEEEEVQHISYRWPILLSAHSQFDHACLHYLTQHDHR